MKIFGIIGLSLLLAGCATTTSSQPQPVTQTVKYELTAAEEAAVKDGAAKSLIDPTSAIVGAMFAAKEASTGYVHVCGYVNGKNRFGAYVGDQLYYGILGRISDGPKPFDFFRIVSTGSTDSKLYAVREMCKRYGVI